jgi:predicted  nucleic acid-binding Zn-ribbon protein
MTLKTAENEVPTQVPTDDFQALEQKIYRTIEMYRAAKESAATAERDAKRLREQLEEREGENAILRREMIQLKREREEIRGRVEKMLHQIEDAAQEKVAS